MLLPTKGFGVSDASDAEVAHAGLFSVVFCLSAGVERLRCRLVELSAGRRAVIDECVTVKPWSKGKQLRLRVQEDPGQPCYHLVITSYLQ